MPLPVTFGDIAQRTPVGKWEVRDVVFPAPYADTVVTHKLASSLVRFKVVDQNVPGIVFRGTKLPTNDYLVLQATVAGTYHIQLELEVSIPTIEMVTGSSTAGPSSIPHSALPSDVAYAVRGTWTPSDVSGAGLTFASTTASYTKIDNVVFASAAIQYPVTANGAAVKIGGLPFTVGGVPGAAPVQFTNSTLTILGYARENSTQVELFNTGGGAITNAQLSNFFIEFTTVYLV